MDTWPATPTQESSDTDILKWVSAMCNRDFQYFRDMTGVEIAATIRCLLKKPDDKPPIVGRLQEHLRVNGGVALAHTRDDYLAASHWGEEEPGSPMAGAASYGLADTLEEALDQMLSQAGL